MKVGTIVKIGNSNVQGEVVETSGNEVLVEHIATIDNQKKLIQQWYFGDIVNPVEEKIEIPFTDIVKEPKNKKKTKKIEFGVIPKEEKK